MNKKINKVEPKAINALNGIIFIIGYPRSGTTFLEEILYETCDCSMSNEVVFIRNKKKIIKKFSKKCENMGLLIESLLKDRFFAWYSEIYSRKFNKKINIEKDLILNRYSVVNAIDVVIAILDIIARNCNRKRLLCKDPGLTEETKFLFEFFPNCKIIHIIRDGRDCYLSMKKVKWGDGNAFITAFRWRRFIKSARKFDFKYANSYLEIKYEDLLAYPGKTGKKIIDFITIDDSKRLKAFENYIINKKIKYNTEKWRQFFKKKELQIFEYVAGDILQLFGYERIYPDIKFHRICMALYFLEDFFIRIYKKYFTKLPM
jgi:hypothetical protein